MGEMVRLGEQGRDEYLTDNSDDYSCRSGVSRERNIGSGGLPMTAVKTIFAGQNQSRTKT